MQIDHSQLPSKLETMDDYRQASLNFVLPFIQERAERVADILHELYAKVDKEKELTGEEIDFFLNDLREAVSFVDEKNPLSKYFQQVLDLETRLENDGAFESETFE